MAKAKNASVQNAQSANYKEAPRGQLRVDPDYCASWRVGTVAAINFEILAKELTDWIDMNPKIMIIEHYLVGKKITYQTVSDWCKNSPLFKAAYEYAKTVIFLRREQGALEHKLDSTYVKFSNPLYSRQWVELEQWRSKLKAYEDKAKTPEIVMVKTPHIPNVPEVPEVPDLT